MDQCGICYSSFGATNTTVASPTRKAKVLSCQHVLCSDCLASNLKALPERGIVAVTCPFCGELTVKDLPPSYSAQLTESVDELHMSRISSYDSDMSISNVNTTPVQYYEHSNIGDFYPDNSDLHMEMEFTHLPDDILNCYDEDGATAAPNYEDIYVQNDSIHDSSQLDNDPDVSNLTELTRTRPAPHTSVGDDSHSMVSDAASLLPPAGARDTAWLHVLCNCLVFGYVLLILVFGPDAVLQNAYWQIQTSVTVKRVVGALLIVHYALLEAAPSALTQSLSAPTWAGARLLTRSDAAAVASLMALTGRDLAVSLCSSFLQWLGITLARMDPVSRTYAIVATAVATSTLIVAVGVYLLEGLQVGGQAREEEGNVTEEVRSETESVLTDTPAKPRAHDSQPYEPQRRQQLHRREQEHGYGQPNFQQSPILHAPVSTKHVRARSTSPRRRLRHSGVNPMRRRRPVTSPTRRRVHMASSSEDHHNDGVGERGHRPQHHVGQSHRSAVEDVVRERDADRRAPVTPVSFRDALQEEGVPQPAGKVAAAAAVPVVSTPSPLPRRAENSVKDSAEDEQDLEQAAAHLATQLLASRAAPFRPAQSVPPQQDVKGAKVEPMDGQAGEDMISYRQRVFEGHKYSYSSPVGQAPSQQPSPTASQSRLVAASSPAAPISEAAPLAPQTSVAAEVSSVISGTSRGGSIKPDRPMLATAPAPTASREYSPLRASPAAEILGAAATPPGRAASAPHGGYAPAAANTATAAAAVHAPGPRRRSMDAEDMRAALAAMAASTAASVTPPGAAVGEATAAGRPALTRRSTMAGPMFASGTATVTRSPNGLNGTHAAAAATVTPVNESNSQRSEQLGTAPTRAILRTNSAPLSPPKASLAATGAQLQSPPKSSEGSAVKASSSSAGAANTSTAAGQMGAALQAAQSAETHKRQRNLDAPAEDVVEGVVADTATTVALTTAADLVSVGSGQTSESSVPRRKKRVKVKGWRSAYAYSPGGAQNSTTPGSSSKNSIDSAVPTVDSSRGTGDSALPSEGPRNTSASAPTGSGQASVVGSVNSAGSGGSRRSKDQAISPQSIRTAKQNQTECTPTRSAPKAGPSASAPSSTGSGADLSLLSRSAEKPTSSGGSYSQMFERRASSSALLLSPSAPAAQEQVLSNSTSIPSNPKAQAVKPNQDGDGDVPSQATTRSPEGAAPTARHTTLNIEVDAEADESDASSDTTFCSDREDQEPRARCVTDAPSSSLPQTPAAAAGVSLRRPSMRDRATLQQVQVSPAPERDHLPPKYGEASPANVRSPLQGVSGVVVSYAGGDGDGEGDDDDGNDGNDGDDDGDDGEGTAAMQLPAEQSGLSLAHAEQLRLGAPLPGAAGPPTSLASMVEVAESSDSERADSPESASDPNSSQRKNRAAEERDADDAAGVGVETIVGDQEPVIGQEEVGETTGSNHSASVVQDVQDVQGDSTPPAHGPVFMELGSQDALALESAVALFDDHTGPAVSGEPAAESAATSTEEQPFSDRYDDDDEVDGNLGGGGVGDQPSAAVADGPEEAVPVMAAPSTTASDQPNHQLADLDLSRIQSAEDVGAMEGAVAMDATLTSVEDAVMHAVPDQPDQEPARAADSAASAWSYPTPARASPASREQAASMNQTPSSAVQPGADVSLSQLAAMSASKLPVGVYTPHMAPLPQPSPNVDPLPISPYEGAGGNGSNHSSPPSAASSANSPLGDGGGSGTGQGPRSRSRIRASITERVNARLRRGSHSATAGDLLSLNTGTDSETGAAVPHSEGATPTNSSSNVGAPVGGSGGAGSLRTKEDVDRFEREMDAMFSDYLPTPAPNAGTGSGATPGSEASSRPLPAPARSSSSAGPDTGTSAGTPVEAATLKDSSESPEPPVVMVSTGTSPIRVLSHQPSGQPISDPQTYSTDVAEPPQRVPFSSSPAKLVPPQKSNSGSAAAQLFPAAGTDNSVLGAIEAEQSPSQPSKAQSPVKSPAKSPLSPSVVSTSHIAEVVNRSSRMLSRHASMVGSPSGTTEAGAGKGGGPVSASSGAPIGTKTLASRRHSMTATELRSAMLQSPPLPPPGSALKSPPSTASLLSTISTASAATANPTPTTTGLKSAPSSAKLRSTPSSLDLVATTMDSESCYIVLIHMNPALTTPRCIGKIAKCVSTVLSQCQQRRCPVTVAVATPLSSATALSYLYAVLNDKTAGGGGAGSTGMASSGASITSTASEGEYVVKSRTRACFFHGSRRANDPSAADINVSERALRAAIKDLLAPEGPALANLLAHTPTSMLDVRAKFEDHLRSLRGEMKTALAAFPDSSDIVVVTDGSGWPFVPPAQTSSAALSEWTAYRASVPQLQLHFVAISSGSSSSSGTRSGSASQRGSISQAPASAAQGGTF